MTRLTIIGGGRMGEALLAGLIDADGAGHDELVVVETAAARAATLRDRYPEVEVRETPDRTDGVILAVKPAAAAGVAAGLRGLGVARVLSIAAGVTTAGLEAELDADTAVLRAMPNTPALVRSAATALAAGSRADESDVAWAEELLGAIGTVVRVAESHLDAVTGLSGSGPAYVFLVVEALVEAGVLNGLDRSVAAALAVQTLVGSARLLTGEDADPAALRAAVTSPGGTTAAGLAALEHGGMRAAILDAVTAATTRSRELG